MFTLFVNVRFVPDPPESRSSVLTYGIGWVLVQDNYILNVGYGSPPKFDIPPEAITVINDNGLWIAPGGIDEQCNGFFSCNFGNATKEEIIAALRQALAYGWSGLFITIITDDPAKMIAAAKVAVEVANDPIYGPMVLGIKIEGPHFLPGPAIGAHDPVWIQPIIDEKVLYFPIREIVPASMVLDFIIDPGCENALQFVIKARKDGTSVGGGHADFGRDDPARYLKLATYDEVASAGLNHWVHGGNGFRSMAYRNSLEQIWHDDIFGELGYLGLAFQDPRVPVGMILDFKHLLPWLVKKFLELQGILGSHFTTDAMAAAGMGDGEFRIGSRTVFARGGVVYSDAEGKFLAGSATDPRTIITNALSLGIKLEDAWQMMCFNVARLFELDDQYGSLRIGNKAMLVLFSLENGQVEIKLNVIDGNVLYRAPDF